MPGRSSLISWKSTSALFARSHVCLFLGCASQRHCHADVDSLVLCATGLSDAASLIQSIPRALAPRDVASLDCLSKMGCCESAWARVVATTELDDRVAFVLIDNIVALSSS